MRAKNGREGLEALAKHPDTEVIVLDINMPVMNGIQFMEKLKTENLYRHIPIIVISTEGKEEDTLRAMKLGAWGYMVKPFKPPMLFELIDKVMSKKPPVLSTGKY